MDNGEKKEHVLTYASPCGGIGIPNATVRDAVLQILHPGRLIVAVGLFFGGEEKVGM